MTRPDAREHGYREVITAELRDCIAGRRGARDREAYSFERAFDLGLVGLALSGGGLRSACFDLGLLQALGKRGVLESCDYLSTVSGGGYIGSCLSSLCADPRVDLEPGTFPFAFDGVEEGAEIKHLRHHSQYLAPRLGPFRLDTWRLVSTYLGGFVLSLVTVGALLAVAAAIVILIYPRIVGLIEAAIGHPAAHARDLWDHPKAHAAYLFVPAALAALEWARMSLLYTGAKIRPAKWTLEYRRRLTTRQGSALRLAALLALAGCVPLLMAAVDPILMKLRPFLAATGLLSALSLFRAFEIGEQAREFPAQIKRALVALGGGVFVVLFCLTILYLLWRQRPHTPMILGASLLVIALLAASTDINWVSMFYFYRDRLSEAFVIRRDSKGSGGVAGNDGLLLSDLAYADRRRPYPLINATVNLAGSDDLTLRGRRADFFLMSPLHCGSQATGYRPTREYENNTLSLATAMAVSGAAANPQHGERTRPALAFLMTLLNVRLGRWSENPLFAPAGRRRLITPRSFWPYYLVRELLAASSERQRLVNLSDGGHIENLGVYELLRRRCRVIIASDAGADPGRTFEDLGNLIRKARIDMGIHIALGDEEMAALRPDPADGVSKRHAILGRIDYSPERGPGQVGMLIYVKASLTADDPRDLHEYRSAHPSFPHEKTADQFFDEAQFESYRELGYQSGKAVVSLIREMRIPGLAAPAGAP